MVLQDDNGQYHIEDLWRDPGPNRATIRDLTLYLFTPNNPANPNIISAENFNAIHSSQFDSSRVNVFIAHGWNSNFNSNINHAIRIAILNRHNANVFVVDWSGPANQFYTSAMSAVPVMGNFLGDFINTMMSTFGLTPSNFILTGHSLGAHLVGCAGARVNGLVTSIVGLDPAGPLFTVGNINNRIDPTDGDHVQIIHTNSGLLGFSSSIGDADFRPNGGSSQPGCGLDLVGTCAHSRAWEFFAESIATGNFLARRCGSQGDYTSGNCNNNHQAFMGELIVDRR